MKKVLALVLALCLSLSMVSALADFEINWEDKAVEAEGYGEFYTLNAVALQLWIPNAMEYYDPTDEQLEKGIVALWMTPDQTAAVSAIYNVAGNLTLEALKAAYAEQGYEAEEITVNGISALSVYMPDQDSGLVAFVTDAGNSISICCSGLTACEGFDEVTGFIVASIMAEE